MHYQLLIQSSLPLIPGLSVVYGIDYVSGVACLQGYDLIPREIPDPNAKKVHSCCAIMWNNAILLNTIIGFDFFAIQWSVLTSLLLNYFYVLSVPVGICIFNSYLCLLARVLINFLSPLLYICGFMKLFVYLTFIWFLLQPDDWDDETDGEWKGPKIRNPQYKGPWKGKVNFTFVLFSCYISGFLHESSLNAVFNSC